MTENELRELRMRFAAAAADGGTVEAYGCIFHFFPSKTPSATEFARTTFDGSHSTVPGHLTKLNWSDLAY
jgi:hypothetical protein